MNVEAQWGRGNLYDMYSVNKILVIYAVLGLGNLSPTLQARVTCVQPHPPSILMGPKNESIIIDPLVN